MGLKSCRHLLVLCAALPVLFPAGASARISAWRIAKYSLTFTEHATFKGSPCDAQYDGPAADNMARAASEDAVFTLRGGKSRDILFQYDYLAHGPASLGEIDPGRALREHRQITQTVVDCDTGATTPRSCEASSRYGGGNAEIWGEIESMRTSRRQHRVIVEWGYTPDAGYDCDGDLGLGPPVPLGSSFLKTKAPIHAFYRKRPRIHFSRTWSGGDGYGTHGTQTLKGVLVLRRTTLPGSCFPGRHADRHFVCS
jgi:hypothetical protein